MDLSGSLAVNAALGNLSAKEPLGLEVDEAFSFLYPHVDRITEFFQYEVNEFSVTYFVD